MHQEARLRRIASAGNARATWGQVDGTLANQTDLVAALLGASSSFGLVADAEDDDEFDLRVANTDGTDDLTVSDMTFNVIGI